MCDELFVMCNRLPSTQGFTLEQLARRDGINEDRIAMAGVSLSRMIKECLYCENPVPRLKSNWCDKFNTSPASC